MIHRQEAVIGGRVMSIETGRVAEQASGAVLVRYGDTVILATVVGSNEPREGIDFFPLTVDVEERMYAAGKIPGGFIKREDEPQNMPSSPAVSLIVLSAPSFLKDTATMYKL